jgi:hypothetical protein
MVNSNTVIFNVPGMPHTQPPTRVRYTAGSNFTQCVLYNGESLPAMPFQMDINAPTLA